MDKMDINGMFFHRVCALPGQGNGIFWASAQWLGVRTDECCEEPWCERTLGWLGSHLHKGRFSQSLHDCLWKSQMRAQTQLSVLLLAWNILANWFSPGIVQLAQYGSLLCNLSILSIVYTSHSFHKTNLTSVRCLSPGVGFWFHCVAWVSLTFRAFCSLGCGVLLERSNRVLCIDWFLAPLRTPFAWLLRLCLDLTSANFFGQLESVWVWQRAWQLCGALLWLCLSSRSPMVWPDFPSCAKLFNKDSRKWEHRT